MFSMAGAQGGATGGAQESGEARRTPTARTRSRQWGMPDGRAAVTVEVRNREVWGTARFDAPR
jgi:hypothetical protein